MDDVGIIYGSFGNHRYLFGAVYSILTIRENKCFDDITVVTDIEHNAVDYLESIGINILRSEGASGWKNCCRLKPGICRQSPYETTLFLDCDVIALRDISNIWTLARGLSAVAGPHKSISSMKSTTYSREEVQWTVDTCPPDSKFFNTGVFAWRDADKFFDLWIEEINRFQYVDELAFVRAICRSKISVRSLPNKYNTLHAPAKDTALLHMVGSLHTGGVAQLVNYKKYYPKIFDKCSLLFKEGNTWFNFNTPNWKVS